MNKQEILEFIEEMEEIGDKWEYEDVKRVYGNKTLEQALRSRKSETDTFGSIIGRVLNRKK